jgi:hypothetical protein
VSAGETGPVPRNSPVESENLSELILLS